MRKIKLVKCRLRQNGSSDVDNVRYVALEEFQLWRYYMEKAHGFAVEDPVVSYWVDAEALMEWAEQIAPERLEPVIEVYFYAHSVEGGTTVPIRRRRQKSSMRSTPRAQRPPSSSSGAR